MMSCRMAAPSTMVAASQHLLLTSTYQVTKSCIDIWAEPTSVSEGRGREGGSLRPTGPLQSPGLLSDSKLNSAKAHSRTQTRLSLQGSFLPSCTWLEEGRTSCLQEDKVLSLVLPAEAQGGQSHSAETAVSICGPCQRDLLSPVADPGHCPGIQQHIAGQARELAGCGVYRLGHRQWALLFFSKGLSSALQG